MSGLPKPKAIRDLSGRASRDPVPEPGRPFLFVLDRRGPVSIGQRIAWLVFLAACFQITFDWPSLHHLTGDRARILSGLLSLLCLLFLVPLRGKDNPRGTRTEFLICLVLTGLGMAGALAGQAPRTSLIRTSILLSSGLGGFWCARFLLADQARCRALLNLGLVLFCAFLALKLGQHLLAWPRGLDPQAKHPTAGLLLVLLFAPLSLLSRASVRARLAAWAMMGSAWLLALLILLKSAILMPFILAGAALARKRLRPALVPLLLLLLVALVLVLPRFYSPHRVQQDKESIQFRAELYPFSWQMALRNPLLGNGLLGPRQEFLDRYQVRTETMGKELFGKYVTKVKVSENIILTFMADLGLPFALLYLACAVVMIKKAWGGPPKGLERIFHPLALLLPLLGWAVHSQVFDSLLHPQICWFVHLLLGLASQPRERASRSEAVPVPGNPTEIKA